MAITQLGLHGSQAAYGTFTAKAEDVADTSTIALNGSSISTLTLNGSSIATVTLTSSYLPTLTMRGHSED